MINSFIKGFLISILISYVFLWVMVFITLEQISEMKKLNEKMLEEIQKPQCKAGFTCHRIATYINESMG